MCFEKPPKKWLFETHVASQRVERRLPSQQTTRYQEHRQVESYTHREKTLRTFQLRSNNHSTTSQRASGKENRVQQNFRNKHSPHKEQHGIRSQSYQPRNTVCTHNTIYKVHVSRTCRKTRLNQIDHRPMFVRLQSTLQRRAEKRTGRYHVHQTHYGVALHLLTLGPCTLGTTHHCSHAQQ